MSLSFAQRVLKTRRRVILFHTWTVTKELLAQAIREQRSMDLDVCVDERGEPYLGHSHEYHEKTGEPFFQSMPLWEAVDALARSDIPVIVDCKHLNAWWVVDEVVKRLRPERCLVCCFPAELKFDAARAAGEPDFVSEWNPIERLLEMKRTFPSISTTACAKWLPTDALVAPKHDHLLDSIIRLLKEHAVDTVCLNLPDQTFSNAALQKFLQKGILCHVGVDRIGRDQLSEVYIGETDRLEFATQGFAQELLAHDQSSKIVS